MNLFTIQCVLYFMQMGLEPGTFMDSMCNEKPLLQKDCQTYVCDKLSDPPEDWERDRKLFPECMCILDLRPKP